MKPALTHAIATLLRNVFLPETRDTGTHAPRTTNFKWIFQKFCIAETQREVFVTFGTIWFLDGSKHDAAYQQVYKMAHKPNHRKIKLKKSSNNNKCGTCTTAQIFHRNCMRCKGKKVLSFRVMTYTRNNLKWTKEKKVAHNKPHKRWNMTTKYDNNNVIYSQLIFERIKCPSKQKH